MTESQPEPFRDKVFAPCGRAFFVHYVAIVIFLLGPRLNPDVWIFGVFHFSVALGTILGVAVIALVLYQKLGREYRLTKGGLETVWRWPSPKRQEITWENLGDVLVRRGLMQTILRVGNLILRDKSGKAQMTWFGLANPQEIQAEIDKRRPQSN